MVTPLTSASLIPCPASSWETPDDFFERIEAAGFFYERVRIDQMLPIEKIEENKENKKTHQLLSRQTM